MGASFEWVNVRQRKRYIHLVYPLLSCMRRLGSIVALALILLAVTLTGESGAPPPVVGEASEPPLRFTFAQTMTLAGWQCALSLNSLYINPASTCEYSTPPPGTRRVAADVTLTPLGPPGLIASVQVFSLVDTGRYRYSWRLPDDDPDGSTFPGSLLASRSQHESILSDVADTPGVKYSLELISNGLMGRIVNDRIDRSRPAQI